MVAGALCGACLMCREQCPLRDGLSELRDGPDSGIIGGVEEPTAIWVSSSPFGSLSSLVLAVLLTVNASFLWKLSNEPYAK